MSVLTSTLLNEIETNLASTEIQDLFVVMVNDSDEESGNITCNASYNDIVAAIQANKFIIFNDNSVIAFLSSYWIEKSNYCVSWILSGGELETMAAETATSTTWQTTTSNDDEVLQ